MGLFDILGLPVPRAAKSGVSAADEKASKRASVLAPMATVVMHNASAAPLQFSASSIVNMARWHTPPPSTIAPNAHGTLRVEAEDIETTAGSATYRTGTGKAQAEVAFSWSGRAGEVVVKGSGKYATASRYRENSKAGREYILVFKDTGKLKGPLTDTLDALDRDVDDVERDVDKGRGNAPPPPQSPTEGPAEVRTCKLTIVNRTNGMMTLQSKNLGHPKTMYDAPPPEAVPAGRTGWFQVHSHAEEHPEIGGFVDYALLLDPAPAGVAGPLTVKLAWTAPRANAYVLPPGSGGGVDVKIGGSPANFFFEVDGPPIEFAPPPKKTSQPTLRQGDKSPDGWVEYLQELLNLKASAGLEIDGDFGDLTHDAVVAYQKDLKKKAPEVLDDGIVGDQTWSYLRDGAPAKPATDQRKPHSYVEKGVEARWSAETGALVYLSDSDQATLLAMSVGDADQLAGRSARFRITGPTGTQKVVDGLIGKGAKTSKTDQGFEHLVTIDAFLQLFGGAKEAAKGSYAVEAYFPADLGGDAFSGTLVFDPDDKGEIEMPPVSVDPAP